MVAKLTYYQDSIGFAAHQRKFLAMTRCERSWRDKLAAMGSASLKSYLHFLMTSLAFEPLLLHDPF